MNRKAIAITASGLVLVVLLLLVFVGTKGSLISQIVESDHHRTIEMGAFGSSFPVRSEDDSKLVVSGEVKDKILSIAPPAPGMDMSKASMANRIRRQSNTEWFLSVPYKGDPKKVAAYYRKYVKGSTRPAPRSEDVNGTLPDGSDVWIYFDSYDKAVRIKVTKPEGGL